MVVAIDAVSAAQNFIWTFAGVYSLAILAYILLSWIPQVPSSLRPVQRFLYEVCEPYVRLWRRIIPFSTGPIDLSPMIALIALGVVSSILISLLGRLH